MQSGRHNAKLLNLKRNIQVDFGDFKNRQGLNATVKNPKETFK